MFDNRKPDDHSLPAELAAFEQQLAGMTAALRIDRDRLMFAAGRAAYIAEPSRLVETTAEPSRLAVHFWPAATALTTAASLLLAILLIRDHISHPQTEITQSAVGDMSKTIAASPEPEAYTAMRSLRLAPYQTPPGYLGVRYVALTRGVGALDDNARLPVIDATQAAPPASAKDLLRELMPKSEVPSS